MDMRILIFGILGFSTISCNAETTEPFHNKPVVHVHTVLEGQDLRIDCNATNTLEEEIYWLKNDTKTEFRQNGTELIFNNMRRTAAGEYVCFSNNMTGDQNDSVVREVHKIDVRYPIFVSKSPFVHKVLEGEDLKIDCSVNETDDLVVYWVKNNTTTDCTQNGTTLTFVNINRNMSADYVCYSRNLTSDDNATVEQVVKVDVLYPAEIIEFNISTTVVNESNSFDVRCKFDGNPNPNFIVRNNHDEPHLFAQESLTVIDHVSARCEDQGTWECTGRNILNKRNVTRSGNVTVFCGPHPKYDYMEQSKYKVRAQLGTPAHFVMRNYANPSANYTWSRPDMVFPPQAHTDMQIGNLGNSLLWIDHVKVEDFGSYYLDMSNAYGSDHRNYELIPVGPPERPTSLTYSNVTYNSAKLHWISGFDGGSRQHFLVLRYNEGSYVEFSSYIYEGTNHGPTVWTPATNHGIGEHYEYQLTDLKPDTIYTFFIQADNDQGYGAVLSDNPVVFYTLSSPWQTTTTSLPFFANCCTAGVIVGASLGGLGVLGVLIGIVFIFVMRNRRNSCSVLNERWAHRHLDTQPLQLGVTSEMRKTAIQ